MFIKTTRSSSACFLKGQEASRARASVNLSGSTLTALRGGCRTWLILITTMALMTGCRNEPQMPLLAEAEAFLPAEPDSADTRLKRIDVQKLDGDEEAALYALLRTMADAMQGATSLNDTLVNQAYTFYRDKSGTGTSSDHALVKHFAQSALYMGDWYAEKDSIKVSEDIYRQAIKYSEKAEDWHTCYIAYQRLANQVHWSSVEDALQLIKEGIKVYHKCNDKDENLLSLFHYAAHYASEIDYAHDGDFNDALEMAYKGMEIAKVNHWDSYMQQTEMLLADIYWMKGDYYRALEHARNVPLPDISTAEGIVWNGKLANYYLSCDSLQRAIELFLAPTYIEDVTQTYLYARGLSEVAAHQLIKDSILFYMDSAFTASEMMYLKAQQIKDEYYRDLIQKEKDNDILIYHNKLQKWLFCATSLFIIVFGGLFIRLLLIRKSKAESDRLLLQERQLHHEAKLLHMQKEATFQQERNQALEDSHKKKLATIRHLQNYIIEHTEVTEKLRERPDFEKMTPKEWSDIENLLDEIDDNRMSKLRARFKSLSPEDVRLCIMVRLGMSNPNIGRVYGITPSAVQHRKQTLKKNVLGVVDPKVTLYDFIDSI